MTVYNVENVYKNITDEARQRAVTSKIVNIINSLEDSNTYFSIKSNAEIRNETEKPA